MASPSFSGATASMPTESLSTTTTTTATALDLDVLRSEIMDVMEVEQQRLQQVVSSFLRAHTRRPRLSRRLPSVLLDNRQSPTGTDVPKKPVKSRLGKKTPHTFHPTPSYTLIEARTRSETTDHLHQLGQSQLRSFPRAPDWEEEGGGRHAWRLFEQNVDFDMKRVRDARGLNSHHSVVDYSAFQEVDVARCQRDYVALRFIFRQAFGLAIRHYLDDGRIIYSDSDVGVNLDKPSNQSAAAYLRNRKNNGEVRTEVVGSLRWIQRILGESDSGMDEAQVRKVLALAEELIGRTAREVGNLWRELGIENRHPPSVISDLCTVCSTLFCKLHQYVEHRPERLLSKTSGPSGASSSLTLSDKQVCAQQRCARNPDNLILNRASMRTSPQQLEKIVACLKIRPYADSCTIAAILQDLPCNAIAKVLSKLENTDRGYGQFCEDMRSFDDTLPHFNRTRNMEDVYADLRSVQKIYIPGSGNAYLPCSHSIGSACAPCEGGCTLVWFAARREPRRAVRPPLSRNASGSSSNQVDGGHATKGDAGTNLSNGIDVHNEVDEGDADGDEDDAAIDGGWRCTREEHCVCWERATACDVYCDCSSQCKRQLRGCKCESGCDETCNCYKNHRECNAEVCGCDVGITDHEKQGEFACRNCKIQRQQQRATVPALSMMSGAGFGLFLAESAEAGDLLGDYAGEHFELDSIEGAKRDSLAKYPGLVSYWYNVDGIKAIAKYQPFSYSSSQLRALSTEQKLECRKYEDKKPKRDQVLHAIDSTTTGNRMRLINGSTESRSNCVSRIMYVKGRHHIAIYASRDMTIGTELLLHYGPDYPLYGSESEDSP